MRIVSKISTNYRDPLPPGKLSLRWIQNRCSVQAYVAGSSLPGCSGENEEACLIRLFSYYKYDGREVWAKDKTGPYLVRKESKKND
tara:strand:- start:60 stop:317 length:258 start_codon:yes stop_codon:yes gene_type:complete